MTLRRPAYNKFWLQDHGFWPKQCFRAENPEGNGRSLLSNLSAMLVDAGEWNAQRIVVVKIAAPNHRDVVGNTQAVIESIIHGAHRERIVEAEHPVGSWFKTQELAHRLSPALFRSHIPLAFGDDVIVNYFQSGLSQCSLVSFHAADARTGFRPTNMGDSLASDIDQVPSSQHADGFIVHPDKVRGEAGQA